MIGGVLQTAFGWRANFVFMAALAMIAIAAVARVAAGDAAPAAGEPISLCRSWSQSYGAVLRHRGFLAYLGIITASYAGLFAWVSGASVVLQGVYGLSPLSFGFTFRDRRRRAT